MADPQLTVVEQQLGAVYDAMHAARARTTIVGGLYGQAMGDLYPAEVAASSSTDWALLGTMVANLRMQPGQRLVDVGCGTGGVGLWLARALAACVTGVDVSSTALGLAAARARHFGLPAECADFRLGSLGSTGLPARYADGLVCVDALGHEKDRRKALEEIRRVLTGRPGGPHVRPVPGSAGAAAVERTGAANRPDPGRRGGAAPRTRDVAARLPVVG
ncbi:class I SAM-dependent methyltransferase [Streptomyces sp. NPDC042638]|uniref:class I SAM-dependent methyltransferase n=1 Tax=Streptomyces sp. NPDC042638 TaxID=3154333 RepID=UPI0033C887FB